MTARHAIAVLGILAAGAVVVCVPLAVFLALAAILVAIDAADPDRRAARRRARPVRTVHAQPGGRR
jgi:hypothetical protein